MKYIVTVNNKDYEVDVTDAGASVQEATTAPVAKPVAPAPVVAAPTPVVAPAPAPVAPASSKEGVKIEAPMPGTIFKVLKNIGDTVAVGDVVVILEAMKMENEIISEVSGVVKDVVAVGATINTGDVLTVIG